MTWDVRSRKFADKIRAGNHEKSGHELTALVSGSWGPVVPEAGSEALFREACAGGSALAGLEFRVRLADHIDRALAFHDLAISVTALGGGEGRKDFHDKK